MGNNLQDIRKKIGTIKNTQKITKAMKLVSTSKLRKASQLADRAKIYDSKLNEVFDEILQYVLNRGGISAVQSKLFKVKKTIKVVDIIFITSSRGFCGGFNSITIKEVMRIKRLNEAEGRTVRIYAIGKKGIDYLSFNGVSIKASSTKLVATPTFEDAKEFLASVIEDFVDDKTDKVILVHNGFKNMISQELTRKTLLPFGLHTEHLEGVAKNAILTMEPDDDNIVLGKLAEQYVIYNLYYALLDSLAAEHAARIQAMDTATNNADDLLHALSTEYNKGRQESITTELVEINAGIEAMK